MRKFILETMCLLLALSLVASCGDETDDSSQDVTKALEKAGKEMGSKAREAGKSLREKAREAGKNMSEKAKIAVAASKEKFDDLKTQAGEIDLDSIQKSVEDAGPLVKDQAAAMFESLGERRASVMEMIRKGVGAAAVGGDWQSWLDKAGQALGEMGEQFDTLKKMLQ